MELLNSFLGQGMIASFMGHASLDMLLKDTGISRMKREEKQS